MRVIAVHRYYWPDTPPYASMLRTIVARWAQSGHQVEVLSTQPSYKPQTRLATRPKVEPLDGTTVRRLPAIPQGSRGVRGALNSILFPLLVAFRLLAGRHPDIVMCSTSPPVLLGAAVSLAAKAKGAKFIYHCMDLHPEIGRLSGEFRNPRVFRALLAVEIATCRRADTIVVLSHDMKSAMVERDASLSDKVVVLNNFALADHALRPASEDGDLPANSLETLRVVFTGNLGRFQGLETALRAVAAAGDGVEMVLMGEGSAKAELERLAARLGAADRTHFLPHGSVSRARALMRSADLGLVSLTPEIIRYAYPSKTMTYLAEGLPLLVVVEPESELARSVMTHGLGYVVAPADGSSMASTLRQIRDDRSTLTGMKQRSRAFGRKEFDKELALDRWSQLISALSDRREADHF